MDSTDSILEAAGLRSEAVKAFVREWAGVSQPDRVEVVSEADDERLLEEALASGEVLPVSGGRYYARSFAKDTARSEERTFVATSKPEDRGLYNNWVLSSEIKPKVIRLIQGASYGKTMYVVPYFMAPPGGPFDAWAGGVELTDSRVVVLHMIGMSRVGPAVLNGVNSFVRGVHV